MEDVRSVSVAVIGGREERRKEEGGCEVVYRVVLCKNDVEMGFGYAFVELKGREGVIT